MVNPGSVHGFPSPLGLRPSHSFPLRGRLRRFPKPDSGLERKRKSGGDEQRQAARSRKARETAKVASPGRTPEENKPRAPTTHPKVEGKVRRCGAPGPRPGWGAESGESSGSPSRAGGLSSGGRPGDQNAKRNPPRADVEDPTGRRKSEPQR